MVLSVGLRRGPAIHPQEHVLHHLVAQLPPATQTRHADYAPAAAAARFLCVATCILLRGGRGYCDVDTAGREGGGQHARRARRWGQRGAAIRSLEPRQSQHAWHRKIYSEAAAAVYACSSSSSIIIISSSSSSSKQRMSDHVTPTVNFLPAQ